MLTKYEVVASDSRFGKLFLIRDATNLIKVKTVCKVTYLLSNSHIWYLKGPYNIIPKWLPFKIWCSNSPRIQLLIEPRKSSNFAFSFDREPRGNLENLQSTILILQKIYQCDFMQMPWIGLKSFTYYKPSTGSDVLLKNKCFGDKADTNPILRYGCRHYLSMLCRQSSGVLIKTLRISAEVLPYLYELVPDVKIVHLFRDPRAVLKSRQNFAGLKSRISIATYAHQLCSRISYDIQYFKSQSDNFHFNPLMYDCLASNPKLVINKLYGKLQLTFNESTISWIDKYLNASVNITKSGGGVRPKNAAEIASLWRTLYNINTVKIIDTQCRTLYNEIGLRLFSSARELLNLAFPSYKLSSYNHQYCNDE